MHANCSEGHYFKDGSTSAWVTCDCGSVYEGSDFELHYGYCASPDCAQAQEVANASVVGSYESVFQSVVMYECDDEFLATGVMTSQCQWNESWSSPLHRCERKF